MFVSVVMYISIKYKLNQQSIATVIMFRKIIGQSVNQRVTYQNFQCYH